MSKIAVISDIHANIHALDLVLKQIEKDNVDEIFCLGDLVTKYFYPAEVVDLIKESCSVVIKGNCDELVSTDERYVFAREKLGLSRIEYLQNLPFEHNINLNSININFYHSCPNSLERIFNPLFDGNEYASCKDRIIYDYNEMFKDEKSQVSVVGHTHQNYVAKVDNDLELLNDKTTLSNKYRYIINVGSVGEHSHMELENYTPITIIDPYITYALLNIKENTITVEIKKIPYIKTLEKIYIDMIIKQGCNRIPQSPDDTKKIQKSLKLMIK